MRGRHKDSFTEREIALVKELAAHHVTKDGIASALGISKPTLNSYFFAEIEAARHEGKQRVLDMLWYKAKFSDKVLLHLADRILGPVPKVYKDITTMSDEEYVAEGQRRIDAKRGEPIDIGDTSAISVLPETQDDPEPVR